MIHSKSRQYALIFLSFFRLIRVGNLLMLVLTQYFTRFFLVNDSKKILSILSEKEIFLLALCTVLVAASGYVINDYYDIKIDMVNKPNRVVLNKFIKRRLGIIFHFTFSFLAVAIALLGLGINVALFMSGAVFLLWLYSNYLKRTVFWGNLSIALLAFSTLYIIALYYKSNVDRILVFSIFAFITTLIREIVKDMEDTKGDRLYGCITIPIKYGTYQSKKIIYSLLALNITVILVSYSVVGLYAYGYLLFTLLVASGIIAFFMFRSENSNDFSFVSLGIKYLMLFGIMGMCLVR